MLLSAESARLGPAPFRFAPRGVRFEGSVDDQTYEGDPYGTDYGAAPTPVDTSAGGTTDTSGGGSVASNPWGADYTIPDTFQPGGSSYSAPGPTTFDANTGFYSQDGQVVGGSVPGSPGFIAPIDEGTGTSYPDWSNSQISQFFNSPAYPGTNSQAGNYYFGSGAGAQQGWAAVGQGPAGQGAAPTPMGMGGGNGPAAGSSPVFHAAMIPGDQQASPNTGVPTSQDGQSLFDQDPQTQQLFQGTYGEGAAAEWARENDASLSASLPQGAQLPADALPGRNDQTTVPGPRPALNTGTGGQPPNMAGAPTPGTATAPAAPTPGAGGTHQVVTPDGKVLSLSDEGYAAYNRSLQAANTQANADRTYKQGQEALANQRADKALDIQKIRDAGQAAYQNALAASRDREVANQAAYQAAQVELERQRVEMQNQGNMQTAAYQQAALSQTARTEANRVNQQREATDLQRRLLPTTRLARRGTTVQIT